MGDPVDRWVLTIRILLIWMGICLHFVGTHARNERQTDNIGTVIDFADVFPDGPERCVRFAVVGEISFRLRHTRALEAEHSMQRFSVCALQVGSKLRVCGAPIRCVELRKIAHGD